MKTPEFRSLIRYGMEVPGYYVNIKADLYSSKSKKILAPSPVYDSNIKGNRLRHLAYRLSIPKGLYEDYDHKRHDSDTTAKLSLTAHRAVAETWMPIDEFPPESICEYWDQVITEDMVGQKRIPEPVKQWVRDTAIVDHKDDDPRNNHVSNLRWVTPKQNQPHRKAAEFSNDADESELISNMSWNTLYQTYEFL